MAGKQRNRAVKLLGEQNARQLMRKGHPSERQRKVGIGEAFGIMPVGAPEGKDAFSDALVAPAGDEVGEIARAEAPAALVEQDQMASVLPPPPEQRRFLALALG